MFLPPFPEFFGQIDMDKFLFDAVQFGGTTMTEPTEIFTKEQMKLMMKLLLAVSLAVLMKYHSLLNEELSKKQEECQ